MGKGVDMTIGRMRIVNIISNAYARKLLQFIPGNAFSSQPLENKDEQEEVIVIVVEECVCNSVCTTLLAVPARNMFYANIFSSRPAGSEEYIANSFVGKKKNLFSLVRRPTWRRATLTLNISANTASTFSALLAIDCPANCPQIAR